MAHFLKTKNKTSKPDQKKFGNQLGDALLQIYKFSESRVLQLFLELDGPRSFVFSQWALSRFFHSHFRL